MCVCARRLQLHVAWWLNFDRHSNRESSHSQCFSHCFLQSTSHLNKSVRHLRIYFVFEALSSFYWKLQLSCFHFLSYCRNDLCARELHLHTCWWILILDINLCIWRSKLESLFRKSKLLKLYWWHVCLSKWVENVSRNFNSH